MNRLGLSTTVKRSEAISRIMAIAFYIAKEKAPGTITKPWVAKYLNRPESFVKRNWTGDPFNCDMSPADCRPHETRESLSQESKDVITESLGRKKKSLKDFVEDIERVRGKKKSKSSVYRFLQTQGASSFHQSTAPQLSETNVSDRLWFCDFLGEWETNDFLFLAPSDEFFIYESQRTNFQNDRIWAISVDDIQQNSNFGKLGGQQNASVFFSVLQQKE